MPEAEEDEVEKFREFLDQVNPDDFVTGEEPKSLSQRRSVRTRSPARVRPLGRQSQAVVEGSDNRSGGHRRVVDPGRSRVVAFGRV